MYIVVIDKTWERLECIREGDIELYYDIVTILSDKDIVEEYFLNVSDETWNTFKDPYAKRVFLTSSPLWKDRGFPSRGLIVPTIGSGLHPSSGGQSSGSENHSHLKGGLSSLSSSPLREEDTACSSHSPIKPSIELERSVVSVTKRNFDKGVFKLSIRGLSIPTLKGEAFRPLNPHFL